MIWIRVGSLAFSIAALILAWRATRRINRANASINKMIEAQNRADAARRQHFNECLDWTLEEHSETLRRLKETDDEDKDLHPDPG